MKLIMKAVILSSLICSPAVFADEGESKLTKWASKATAKLVTGTKDVMAGIQKGVDDGRQSGESLDGAIVIADGNYQKYVDVQVESAEQKEGYYEFTLVFKNKTDNIVRITNLHASKNIYLMDDQGFTTSTMGEDVTILKNASTKKTFSASTKPLSGKVQTLYLFDKKLDLP